VAEMTAHRAITDLQIIPGEYEHYKGKKYFVLGLSKNTETNEVCVVYRPLYETDWPYLVHRNATMFFENVTVNGKQVPRFRRTGPNDITDNDEQESRPL
jgi:hypothetical protein